MVCQLAFGLLLELHVLLLNQFPTPVGKRGVLLQIYGIFVRNDPRKQIETGFCLGVRVALLRHRHLNQIWYFLRLISQGFPFLDQLLGGRSCIVSVHVLLDKGSFWPYLFAIPVNLFGVLIVDLRKAHGLIREVVCDKTHSFPWRRTYTQNLLLWALRSTPCTQNDAISPELNWINLVQLNNHVSLLHYRFGLSFRESFERLILGKLMLFVFKLVHNWWILLFSRLLRLLAGPTMRCVGYLLGYDTDAGV